MTKNQITIGQTYAAKISGTVQPVRITGESQYGGWDGQNLNTGREVRIKTAGKLRCEIEQADGKWRRKVAVKAEAKQPVEDDGYQGASDPIHAPDHNWPYPPDAD